MEKMLQELAAKLNGYDEASLAVLWEKYHSLVQNYQPSKSWEEAVLVLGMIQSVRWKNQLFNHFWAEQSKPGQSGRPRPAGSTVREVTGLDNSGNAPDKSLENGFAKKSDSSLPRSKVLVFPGKSKP